jgi:hypothetical protein
MSILLDINFNIIVGFVKKNDSSILITKIINGNDIEKLGVSEYILSSTLTFLYTLFFISNLLIVFELYFLHLKIN